MKKRFKTLRQLRKWLASTTLASVSAIYLIEDAGSIEITNNPNFMEHLITDSTYQLPKGPYFVEYEYRSDKPQPDIDYSKRVAVIGLDVTLAQNLTVYGKLRELLAALGDYEYCVTSFQNNPGYRLASLWVVEPDSPEEMKALKDILDRYAYAYSFNDGSGEITPANFRITENPIR
jgi:hypothetical protein